LIAGWITERLALQFELCVMSLLFHHISLITVDEAEVKDTKPTNDSNL
jgi:hypothetical protein